LEVAFVGNKAGKPYNQQLERLAETKALVIKQHCILTIPIVRQQDKRKDQHPPWQSQNSTNA